MIEDSDNTATNRCIDLIGMDAVNRMMQALDLKNTRLRRKMIDPDAAARDDENVSTPMEMAHLMTLIHDGKAVDPEASKEIGPSSQACWKGLYPSHAARSNSYAHKLQ